MRQTFAKPTHRKASVCSWRAGFSALLLLSCLVSLGCRSVQPELKYFGYTSSQIHEGAFPPMRFPPAIKVAWLTPEVEYVTHGTEGAFLANMMSGAPFADYAGHPLTVGLWVAEKIVSGLYGAVGELTSAASEKPQAPVSLNPGTSLFDRLPLKRVGDAPEPLPSRADAVMAIQLIGAGLTPEEGSFRAYRFGLGLHVRFVGGEDLHTLADIVMVERTQALPLAYWRALTEEEWGTLAGEIELRLSKRFQLMLADTLRAHGRWRSNPHGVTSGVGSTP